MRHTGLLSGRFILFLTMVFSSALAHGQPPVSPDAGVPFPDVRALLHAIVPLDSSLKPRTSADSPGTYAGIGIAITKAEHRLSDNQVAIEAEPVGEGSGVPFMVKSGTPLIVPVDDAGIDNALQYVLYQDGQEVERGDVDLSQNHFRYSSIPFSPIARGIRVGPVAFTPNVPAGNYEVQLELRSISVQLEYFNSDRDAWGYGPRKNTGEAFTLVSNKAPMTIHPPFALTPESLEALARMLETPDTKPREMDLAYLTSQNERLTEKAYVRGANGAGWRLAMAGAAALPAVLSKYDPAHPSPAHLQCLARMDTPDARAAVERAASEGNAIAKKLLESASPKPLDAVVGEATGVIGSGDWNWWDSRDALEALDGKLYPEHAASTQALIQELAARLDSERDRYAGRAGESLWGAFRTAFFLGRIGDAAAIPVLERASNAAQVDRNNWESASRCVLLRWYAAAARKLIEVQQLPAEAKRPALEAWVRHCFDSPEEHYMARARLLPYLCELLGDAAPDVLSLLSPADSWMAADVKRLAG